MIRRDAVRLIAEREIRTRIRAKSFRVALGIALVGVVAGVVLPNVLDRPDDPYEVLVLGSLSDPELEAVRFAGTAVGRDVEVTDATTETDARRALEVGDADLVVDVGSGTLIVRRVPATSDTSTFARFLSTLGGSLRVYAGLYKSGLGPVAARAALSHPPPAVIGILPPRDERTAQKAITMVGIIAIFVFIQQYGFWVINGVVEEKSSRVIEVLLSVVRPNELLLGKTVGIGVVALGHGLLLTLAALVAATITGGSLLEDGGLGLMIGMLGWFALAYALYCLLMAMAGALVARQEDAQNVSFPVIVPLLFGYVTSVATVFGSETPPLVTVLSFVPLTAPVSMPARLAAGNVPFAEVAISVALVLAAIVLVARVASVVYARGVLHTSGRLKWRAVLSGEVGR